MWEDAKLIINENNQTTYMSLIPYITINRSGSITFSRKFVQDNPDIQSSIYVVLGYSPKNKAIIFTFHDQSKLGAHKITKKPKYAIFSKSFFKSINIDYKIVCGRYKPELHEIPDLGQCWVIFHDKPLDK